MIRRVLSMMLAAVMTIIVFMPVTTTAGAASTEPEFAWVLVEVNDYENAEKWADADAHSSYIVKHSYSRGVYSASKTFEGEDIYDTGLGGTLAVNAMFSGVPDIIYADKPVSLKFKFTTTVDTVNKLSFTASANADFDRWDVPPGGATGSRVEFANKDEESRFTIIGERSVSYDETLTATLGAGRENSRIALRLMFAFGVAMGTNYVYEWKQVGETPAATVPETSPESSEDQPELAAWERTWEDNRSRADILYKSEFWIKWAEQARQWTPEEIEAVQKRTTTGIVQIGDLIGETWILRAWEEDIDQAIYAELDTPLYHGDLIITRSRSGAILSFSDMSSFVIKENSAIVLDIKADNQSKIGLVAGNVWTNLKKMVTGGSMEIEMGQAVAGIKGTILAASVSEAGEEVYLFTSSAEVTSKENGQTITLKPGQKALINQTGDIQVEKFDIASQAKAFDISMSDLKADGYKEGQISGLIWILLVLATVILAIIVTLLVRKNRKRTLVAQSTTVIPAGPYSQAMPKSLPRKAYCPNCGNPINDGQRFCQHCGKDVSKG